MLCQDIRWSQKIKCVQTLSLWTQCGDASFWLRHSEGFHVCLTSRQFSENCDTVSVQGNSHQLVYLYEASWGHSCYRPWRLLKTLFALSRYWKYTGSFKKYSITAYCFSDISGHIVEQCQFLPAIALNRASVYTPTHLPYTSKNSFLVEVPGEGGTS